MAQTILIKRGTQDQILAGSMTLGELAFATDTKLAFVYNGTSKTLVGKVLTGLLSARPTAGITGRQYFASDTGITYIDDGTSWNAIGGRIPWSAVTSNTNAAAYNGYMIDASSNPVTLTLPASPTIGDEVPFVVVDRTNTITIARNGNPIMGVAEDMIVDYDNASFALIFKDGTAGWRTKPLM